MTMPFLTLSSSSLHRIPHLEGAPSYVHFGEFNPLLDENYQVSLIYSS